jgi:type I restriction enzyme S subunit
VGEWRRVRIGDFLSERKGKFKPGAGAIEGLQRVDKIDFSGNIHLSNKDSKTDLIMVCQGDLLISGINVAKGAVAIYHGESPVVASIHYSSYTFDENLVSIEYFRRFVRSPLFDEILKEQVRGGIKTEIKAKDFLPLQIHLPDLDTQQEIVAKFEDVENEISDISGEATHQASLIKQLRQAVLQEAVEGKLTADWRRQHPLVKGDPQHDAAALLVQIKAAKERLVEAGKIRKEKPLSPIADGDKPFELPEGWVWCRFGNYSRFERGRFSIRPRNDKRYFGGPYPFVQIGGLSESGNSISSAPQSLNEMGLAASKMFDAETILIAIVGGTIGNLGVLAIPMCFPDSIVGIRPTDLNCHDYIMCLLRHKQPEIRRLAYQMAGQPNIKLPTLQEMVIPLPPLAEQQAIVARVDSLMATIDALEAQVTERKEQAQLLMQAVLREAFAGGDESRRD